MTNNLGVPFQVGLFSPSPRGGANSLTFNQLHRRRSGLSVTIPNALANILPISNGIGVNRRKLLIRVKNAIIDLYTAIIAFCTAIIAFCTVIIAFCTFFLQSKIPKFYLNFINP